MKTKISIKNTSMRKALFYLFTVLVLAACNNAEEQKSSVHADDIINTKAAGEIEAELTDAPNVPKPLTYTSPKKVKVHMEVIEKIGRMADGVEYTFWTFGGSVPGKFIRVRAGDEVEFHLSNHPDSKMPHNIDLHAVTGPGGGAEASLTAPGHTSVFSFKALNVGLYIYHCATAPVGMHIANGMYGLILVEPPGGLSKVDKEFYIVQGDFYTRGKFGEPGLQYFDMDKALREEPDYVVFNGSVGANAGDNAMQVKVGETVRLFVGNGGPNLSSAFHVIGEIFDKVHVEGGELLNYNVQTTTIPPGGSSIVEFKCEAPGTLNIVDHAIFRTFNKGALAQIKVIGDENKIVYSHKQRDDVYLPEGSAVQEISGGPVKAAIAERTKEERLALGKTQYETNCAACHMKDGVGVPGAFPTLVKSDYLANRVDKGIGIIIHGLSGPIQVNGKEFNGVMPAIQMNDDEVANILTYVRTNFSKIDGVVSAAEVAKVRSGK
jgi:nitrite reductase (NO-forming)